VGGSLADRLGKLPIMRVAIWIYAIGALAPLFVHSPLVIVAVLPVAVAAAVVMTLPYALLIDAAPDGDHGLTAGLFDMSRGVGSLAGPLTAGLAITLLEPVLQDTKGYGAMFLVVSLFCFASLYALRRLRRLDEDPTRSG
jgi:MFS family permease